VGHQVGLRDMQRPDPAGLCGHVEYSALHLKNTGGAVEMCWGMELWGCCIPEIR